MNTIDWLSAIGSISTGIAAMIALVALMVTIRSSVASREQAMADEMRLNLSLLGQEVSVLSRMLRDSYAIILTSGHISKGLEAVLGPTATADDFWACLDNRDRGMLGLASVMGWTRSELSKQIDELLNSLRRLRVRLTGALSILRYPVEFYDVIVRESISPAAFVKLFTEPDWWLNLDKDEKSVPRLVSNLANELQLTASLYYTARYFDASTKIDQSVQLAVEALSRLDNNDLVKLSRRPLGWAQQTDTLATTNTMQCLLDQIKLRIPDDAYQELSTLIQDIDQLFHSRTAWTERLDALRAELKASHSPSC